MYLRDHTSLAECFLDSFLKAKVFFSKQKKKKMISGIFKGTGSNGKCFHYHFYRSSEYFQLFVADFRPC